MHDDNTTTAGTLTPSAVISNSKILAAKDPSSTANWLCKRVLLGALLHVAVLVLVYECAFQLAFNAAVPTEMRALLWLTLPWILLLKITVFSLCGIFQGWWRYVSFADLAALLKVATLSTLGIATVDFFLLPGRQIPVTVLALDWGLTILALGGLRSLRRLISEHVWATLFANGKRHAFNYWGGSWR